MKICIAIVFLFWTEDFFLEHEFWKFEDGSRYIDKKQKNVFSVRGKFISFIEIKMLFSIFEFWKKLGFCLYFFQNFPSKEKTFFWNRISFSGGFPVSLRSRDMESIHTNFKINNYTPISFADFLGVKKVSLVRFFFWPL